MSIATETRFESLIKTNRKTICTNIISILKDKTDSVTGKGLTAREIASELFYKGVVKDNSRQQVAPRMSELVDSNIVIIVGKKHDDYSDRNVATYALRI